MQELSEDDEKPSFTVEKFETWFQDDPKVISKLFDKSQTADSKSGFSLAELWVGMFKYYTEEFKFDKDLIQVRLRSEREGTLEIDPLTLVRHMLN